MDVISGWAVVVNGNLKPTIHAEINGAKDEAIELMKVSKANGCLICICSVGVPKGHYLCEIPGLGR